GTIRITGAPGIETALLPQGIALPDIRTRDLGSFQKRSTHPGKLAERSLFKNALGQKNRKVSAPPRNLRARCGFFCAARIRPPSEVGLRRVSIRATIEEAGPCECCPIERNRPACLP